MSAFTIAHGVPLDTLMRFCADHDPNDAQRYLDTFSTDRTGVDVMQALREHAAALATPAAGPMAVEATEAASDPSTTGVGTERREP